MNLNRCAKHTSHWYTVEVVGQAPRYCSTDADAALHALLTVNPDIDEGYVTAEAHMLDHEMIGYCNRAAQLVEVLAILANSEDRPVALAHIA